MWYWASIFALLCCLFLIIEELIYYLWNRYVYGPNFESQNRWKKRYNAFVRFFKRKTNTDIHENNNEKSSL
ncbi:hypothetical protein ABES02_24645 [Neobacillus pocheonensis]|uniref:hypothetical protein n=1 Tax=Neobacillus pocheonensis TaxID=363869 RepID=UPI003D277612